MKKAPELTDAISHATFALVTSWDDTWLLELWEYKGLCIFSSGYSRKINRKYKETVRPVVIYLALCLRSHWITAQAL